MVGTKSTGHSRSSTGRPRHLVYLFHRAQLRSLRANSQTHAPCLPNRDASWRGVTIQVAAGVTRSWESDLQQPVDFVPIILTTKLAHNMFPGDY